MPPRHSDSSPRPGEQMPVIGPQGIERPAVSGEVVHHRRSADAGRRLPPPEQHLVAVFGDCDRRGQFVVAPNTSAYSVFGDVKIDLREAVVESETIEIRAYAGFGDVKLTVPPGYTVHVRGFHVFGDTKEDVRPSPTPGPDDRTIILHAYGLFGDVKVKTRELGEKDPSFRDRFRQKFTKGKGTGKGEAGPPEVTP